MSENLLRIVDSGSPNIAATSRVVLPSESAAMMAACFSGENAFGFRPRFPGSGAGFAFAMPAPCYFWRLGFLPFAAVFSA
jgi:hypothetical protein